jgi:hypothetical protein
VPKATPPITNFTAGEWSPRLDGRVDIDRYGQACSELVNMTLAPHGPVTRRMGTYYVTEAVSAASRLIEFVYNTEQAYVLEFSPGLIRFFRDGGYLVGKDISSPYTAADIAVLNYCQAADLMYLVCPRVAPRKLTRPGADAFALAPVNFSTPPADWSEANWPGCATFYQQRLWFAGCPQNAQKIWASRTGDFENFSKTAAAEDGAFQAAYAPNTIYYRRSGAFVANRYELITEAMYRKTNPDFDAKVYKLAYGVGQAYEYAGTETVQNGTNENGDPVYDTVPVYTSITEALYSKGTTSSDDDEEEGDDAALTLSLVSEQVNAVRWLLGQKVLVAGTSGGEWILSGGSDAALTPKNLSAKLNSNYGCAAVRPLLIGAVSSHVSADARRLMSFAYDYGSDSHVAAELSLLAEHLTRKGIKETANCQNPDGIVWCVMRDGTMAGCTYLKDQEVVGWHRLVTDGKVLSVACIPEDGYTATWLIVQRATGIFIERMAAPWDGDTTRDPACYYVDCGAVYEGAPVTRITGLNHLEGREVIILADGAEHPRRVVKDGAVDLDDASSVVVVGLPYEWRVTPMRLEGVSPLGTMQGKAALVPEMTVRLDRTLGLHWMLVASGRSYEATFREADGAMDAPPVPYTGDITLPMPGGWHADTRVRLYGDGAFPATVLMMIPTVAINK